MSDEARLPIPEPMPFVSLPIPEPMPWVAAPVPATAAGAPDLSAYLLAGVLPGLLPGGLAPHPAEPGGFGSTVPSPAVEVHQSWPPAAHWPDGPGVTGLPEPFDPMP